MAAALQAFGQGGGRSSGLAGRVPKESPKQRILRRINRSTPKASPNSSPVPEKRSLGLPGGSSRSPRGSAGRSPQSMQMQSVEAEALEERKKAEAKGEIYLTGDAKEDDAAFRCFGSLLMPVSEYLNDCKCESGRDAEVAQLKDAWGVGGVVKAVAKGGAGAVGRASGCHVCG